MPLRAALALAALACPLAKAISSNQPNPTLAAENVYDGLGWTPAPTDAPYFEGGYELVRRGLDMNKRALTSGQLIGYFAPDSICGYISGSIGKF
jgi:hypothetical protein